MTALIFDTETTGGEPPRMIEAAGIFMNEGNEVDLRPAADFSERFNPGVPSTLGALATHHILDSDLEGCPSPEEFNLKLGEEDYLIGHNVDYDWKMIGSPPVRRICTLALARRALPTLESHTLGALAYHFLGGEQARDMLRGKAHGAAVDCEVTRHVLRHLIPFFKVAGAPFTWEALWCASEFSRVPSVMPFGKHKGTAIRDLPGDYVDWMLRQSDIDEYLRKALVSR